MSSNAATGVATVEASTSKPVGRLLHRVAVGHPDPVLGRDVGEQGARAGDADRRTAELGDAGAGHLAAEPLGHRLEAVAHPEHRDAALEQAGVDAPGTRARRPRTGRRRG